jgi:hypothetical protein
MAQNRTYPPLLYNYLIEETEAGVKFRIFTLCVREVN